MAGRGRRPGNNPMEFRRWRGHGAGYCRGDGVNTDSSTQRKYLGGDSTRRRAEAALHKRVQILTIVVFWSSILTAVIVHKWWLVPVGLVRYLVWNQVPREHDAS